MADWRITTPGKQTPDEIGMLLQTLFTMRGLTTEAVAGVVISSVVPPLDAGMRRMCEDTFHLKPLFIEPGVKTGLPILTDNPNEVGADRVVNCVAAFDLVGGPAIVVDLGTATTFDVISRKGEFLGGAIAPGLGISAEALFSRAARLSRVEIKKPAKIIGTNTTDNIQIGLYYGYIGLVDGILERMLAGAGAGDEDHCHRRAGKADRRRQQVHSAGGTDADVERAAPDLGTEPCRAGPGSRPAALGSQP